MEAIIVLFKFLLKLSHVVHCIEKSADEFELHESHDGFCMLDTCILDSSKR